MTRSDCAHFRAVAAELGLGTLTGRERGEALGHLESCTDCRRHLDDLTDAADMLLFLAPGVDPPSGFARRTLARLGPDDQLRARRFTRALLAVAAVFILAAGVALTTSLRHQDAQPAVTAFPRPTESGVHVARFVPAAGQHVNGQVVSHAGKPVPHRELLQAVWGPDYGDQTDYLRVFITHLRKKIEANPAKPQFILTRNPC